MNTTLSNAQTLKDILRCYSGRRLQFAIKLGILPKPENLNKVLKKKDRKSTRLNSSHVSQSRMPSSA